MKKMYVFILVCGWIDCIAAMNQQRSKNTTQKRQTQAIIRRKQNNIIRQKERAIALYELGPRIFPLKKTDVNTI